MRLHLAQKWAFDEKIREQLQKQHFSHEKIVDREYHHKYNTTIWHTKCWMDGLGVKGAFMFEYVEDKEYLSRVRRVCGGIMQDFCHSLKVEYDIGASFYLVGSGARNLIVQNALNPIDLDYNLEIIRCNDFYDCRTIKECAKKAFNKALSMNGWGDCEDSTSSLTTQRRRFEQGNQTAFSMDVCIVFTDNDDNIRRLIHKKTGNTYYDRYYWNQAPHSSGIRKKVDFIKSQGKWSLVREQYLRIKNKYLTSNDHNHPSFVCYMEAVNNVYNSRKNWNDVSTSSHVTCLLY